ncbi:MAG: hypothetical protein RSC08_02060, partial [Oscillospiraceae bacterium]
FSFSSFHLHFSVFLPNFYGLSFNSSSCIVAQYNYDVNSRCNDERCVSGTAGGGARKLTRIFGLSVGKTEKEPKGMTAPRRPAAAAL